MIDILDDPQMVIVFVFSRRLSDVENLLGLQSKYELILFVPFMLHVDTVDIIVICRR
jgi:hypothetical protein